MSKNADQLTEELFGAIQTLIDKSIEGVRIDRTEVCTVLAKPEKVSEPYEVTLDGTSKVKAYGDTLNYSINDEVLVLFPKDDTKQKTILNRYTAEADTAIEFVSQGDRFASIEKVESEDITLILKSNNIGTATESGELKEFFATTSNQIGAFNALYLKATVTTENLYTDDEKVYAGSYGLLVDVLTKDEDKRVSFKLSSEEMFGNPYAFDAGYEQEIICQYALPINEPIESIKIYGYQEGNFLYKDEEGNSQSFDNNDNSRVAQFSNITLGIGFDMQLVEDNTVIIYPQESNEYNKIFDINSETQTKIYTDKEKTMWLAFLNKNENNKYIGFSGATYSKEKAQIKRSIITSIRESKLAQVDENGNTHRWVAMLEDVNSIYNGPSFKYINDKPSNFIVGLKGCQESSEENGTDTAIYESQAEENSFKVGDIVTYALEPVYENSEVQRFTTLEKLDKINNEYPNYYCIEWQADNEYGKLTKQTGEDIKCIIACQDTLEKTRVMGTVWYNGVSYTSEKYELINQLEVNKSLIDMGNIQVKIQHGINSQDNYPLYDGNTMSLIGGGHNAIRQLYFGYDAGDTTIADSFWNGATIEWEAHGNMLRADKESSVMYKIDSKDIQIIRKKDGNITKWQKATGSDNSNLTVVYELPGFDDESKIVDNVTYFARPVEREKGTVYQILGPASTKAGNFVNATYNYYINQYYNPGTSNNHITCKVIVPLEDGECASGEDKKDFSFATFGSSGTDYTIIFNRQEDDLEVKIVDKDGNETQAKIYYWWSGEEDAVKKELQAHFNDSNSEESLPEEGSALKTSNKDNEGKYIINISGRDNSTHNLLYIEAQVPWAGSHVWIKGFYSVLTPSNPGEKYSITAPYSIIYDNNNTNPIYDKNTLNIYDKDNLSKPLEGIKWKIKYYNTKETNLSWKRDLEAEKDDENIRYPFKPIEGSEEGYIEVNYGDENGFVETTLTQPPLKYNIYKAEIKFANSNDDELASVEYNPPKDKGEKEFNTNSLGEEGKFTEDTTLIFKKYPDTPDDWRAWFSVKMNSGYDNEQCHIAAADSDNNLWDGTILAPLPSYGELTGGGKNYTLTVPADYGMTEIKNKYKCTCHTDKDKNDKYIRFSNEDVEALKKSKSLSEGSIIWVTFEKPNEKDKNIKFILADLNGDKIPGCSSISLDPAITWKKEKTTLSFKYSNNKFTQVTCYYYDKQQKIYEKATSCNVNETYYIYNKDKVFITFETKNLDSGKNYKLTYKVNSSEKTHDIASEEQGRKATYSTEITSYITTIGRKNTIYLKDFLLIDTSNSKTYAIVAPEMLLENRPNISLEAYSGETLLVNIPIYIGINLYESSLLNKWDGKLTINHEENYILAAMLGAGQKNADNTFSGVVMGCREKLDESTKRDDIGLFGFDGGQETFSFNVNGTAKLGAVGKGQIIFDGNQGIIKTNGWEKARSGEWKLNKDLVSSGSLIDLDDAIFLMESDKNNYMRFNNNKEGRLELGLSSLDIKLNNEGGKNLQTRFEVTEQGIISEVRRTASYFAVCSTESIENEKTIELEDINNRTDSDSTDTSIKAITTSDILQNGVMMAVTFENEQSIEEVTTYYATKKDDSEQIIISFEGTQNWQEANKDNIYILIKTEISRIGEELSLKIGDEEKPIYINKKATGEDNPFGWSAGSTIYFTYSNEAWHVTDSGSYSRTLQTEDMIRNDVGEIGGSLSSSIIQTAGSIRSEVRQFAGYYGECKAAKNSLGPYEVFIENLPSINFSLNDLKQKGVGLAITFINAQKELQNKSLIPKDAKEFITDGNAQAAIKAAIDTGDSYDILAGSTVYFVYNGEQWEITDAGNYSRITQTAHSITSEVRRKAQYYGTCETEDSVVQGGSTTKQIWLKNALKGDSTDDAVDIDKDVYQTGVTIAITFTHPQSTSTNTTKETYNDDNPKPSVSIDEDITVPYDEYTTTTTGNFLYLRLHTSDPGNTTGVLGQKPVYIGDTRVSKNCPFGWTAGSTVYFTYNAKQQTVFTDGSSVTGAWLVSDSGSFSKITQTADMIKAQVETLDGKYGSAITQTAKQIRLEVNQKANYTATCSTAAGTNPKELTITDAAKLTAILDDNTKAVDCIILIKFTNANTVNSGLQFKIKNTNYSFTVNGNPKWEKDETLPFRLYRPANGTGTFTMTSLSNSAITELAHSITSYVDRKGGYACSGKWRNSRWELDIDATDEQGNKLTWNWIKNNNDSHKTIAVTFTDYDDRKQTVNLYTKNNADTDWVSNSVYLSGNITSASNSLTWDKNATLYFTYDNSNSTWRVVDSGAYSKIQQTADAISATVVSKDGGDGSSFTWHLDSDGFYLNNSDTATGDNFKFKCNEDGVEINGKIISTNGSIGGWTIGQNGIYKGEWSTAGTGMSTKTGQPAFWAGWTSSGGYKFKVDQDGTLHATGAQISGDITASNISATATISATQVTGIDTLIADEISAKKLVSTTGTFKGTLSAVSGTFTSLTAQGNLDIGGNRIKFSHGNFIESYNSQGVIYTIIGQLGSGYVFSNEFRANKLTVKGDNGSFYNLKVDKNGVVYAE